MLVMKGRRAVTPALLPSLLHQTQFLSSKNQTTQLSNSLHLAEYSSFPSRRVNPGPSTSSVFVKNPFFLRYLTTHLVNEVDSGTSIAVLDDDDDGANGDEDDKDDGFENDFKSMNSGIDDERLDIYVGVIMEILCEFGHDNVKAKCKLDECNVPASSELVAEVLSRVRNDWAAAYTFFLWAQKQPGYFHSLREYHTMIAILGKMKKFDTAWMVIDDMRRSPGQSMVTPQTLLILIRKYAGVHDVAKAIGTFYAFKRYGFPIGLEEFQDLLSALCRYKNVQDAEHLLLCNENVFELDVKSFNIVLNGWCNLIVSVREAKRFWNEMGRRGIERDAVSYGSLMSCYSKAGSLRDVLKLFDQMKELGIVPDRKVYNAVTFALAKGKCVKEAISLVRTMEENGCAPNSVTYNSMIKPLCKARKLEEARALFDEMLQRGLSPSVRTYHAFLAVAKTVEEVFELLEKMNKTGCRPEIDTYIMLIRKFCRWQQYENVNKIWNEMGAKGPSPDRSAYIVLIHGLFLNGRLEEAYKYYEEMNVKGFAPEPKTEEMLGTWIAAKESSRTQTVELQNRNKGLDKTRKNHQGSLDTSSRNRHFLKQDEVRNVTRERGFSLW